MRINVSQLLKEPIGATRSYKVNEVADITGDSGSHIVHGKIKLLRTDQGVLAKIALRTDVEVTCSRCLSSFDCPLTLNFEEEYFPVLDIIGGTPLSPPDEPGCLTIDEHHILDSTEAARQYALLTIPMKPVCNTNCAGLCSVCGHNLNKGPCGCPPQKADPCWSKLKELSLAGNTSVIELKGAE